MSTQTVFRLTSQKEKGFDALEEFHEPIPSPSKHEVLVKVRSVALNYRDIAIATSTYPLAVKDNVIPCSDVAGEIVQIGEDVTGFSIGDAIVSIISPTLLYGSMKHASDSFGGPVDGMLRQYIVLPAHIVIKLPETSHGFAQWAALVGTGSTVWNCFYGNMPLKPGDTVLLLGKLIAMDHNNNL